MKSTAIENIVTSYIVQSKDIEILTRNGYTSDDFRGSSKEVIRFIEDNIKEFGEVPSEQLVQYEMGDKYSSVKVEDSPLAIEATLQSYFLYSSFHNAIVKNQQKLANGSPQDINDAIEDMIKRTQDALNKTKRRSTGTDLTHDGTRLDLYIQRHAGEGESVYNFGIPTLDEAFGGLQPDDLMVLYARPSVGKSYTATYLARQLYVQGLNVLFYSGEMEANQIGYRWDSIGSGVSARALMRGKTFPEGTTSYVDYIAHLDREKLRPNYMKVLTPKDDFGGRMATVPDLEEIIHLAKPDVIVVDQLSLMADSNRARDMREKFHNIIRDLRLLAEVERVPIIVLSQANRQAATKNEEGEFNVPELDHLAESDAVGQYATRVVGLASKRTQDRDIQILKIGIKKNRHGYLDEFEMMVNFDLGIFQEVEPTDPTDVAETIGHGF